MLSSHPKQKFEKDLIKTTHMRACTRTHTDIRFDLNTRIDVVQF